MKARKRVVIQTAVVFGLLANGASPGFAQRPMRLDERWTVTINGQTAPVLPDGSFRVSNIPVTDFIDLDDPSGGPDDLSDEYYQAIATAVINGRTWYASSEPFRLSRLTYTIDDMTIRRTLAHAVPVSIRVVTEPALTDDKLFIDGTDYTARTIISAARSTSSAFVLRPVLKRIMP